MSKASNVLKSTVTVLATAVAGSLCAAEWLGTASETYWNTAENWESSTGVPVGNIAFSAKAGDNKTVTLDGNNSFNGTFKVSAGTAEAPFVFTAIDAPEELVPTLNQTSTSGLDVTGALKIEKGTWNFANDLKPNGAFIWLTGGRLTTQYWMPVDGETTIRVDGGELVTGFRDNGEQNNGRMNLGRTSGKTVTLIQNGGRIRCSNNTNGGNKAEALTLGEAQNSTVLVEMTGGELVVNGCAHFGYGTSSKGSVTMTGGTFLMPDTDPVLGLGAESVAELSIGGTGVVRVGTSTTAKWFKICENATATSTVTLNEGGVLEIWHVQKNAADGTATLAFNGGTLRALGSDGGYNKYLLGNDGGSVAENLSVTVSEKGGVIDNNGKHIRINQPISGEGTLTFAGSGYTEVLQELACSVRVAQGSLAVPSGSEFPELEIEPGAFLFLTSETTPEAGVTFLKVSNDISDLANRIVIDGLKTVISQSDGKWIVRGEAYGEGELPTYVIPEGVSFVIESADTWALAANWVVNGSLTLRENMTFAGNLSGTGEVEVLTPCTFTGNNEAFAGTVNKPRKEALNFNSETSGSPLASWNIGGDCATSLSEGTIKFGQIDYHQKDNWYVFYAKNATVAGKYVTLEIGAKGGNSNLGTAERVCNSGNNLNIRKVGTGNLDMWFNLYKKIDLQEGTVSFRNNNGPSDEYNFTGGTMRLPYCPDWKFLDRIKNSTGPVDIDTCGNDWTMYNRGNIDSSNTGGFTKRGDGILTFWGDLAYTGPTTVLGGQLCMRGGLDHGENNVITVAEGAKLALYANTLTLEDGAASVLLKGKVDDASASRIVATGVNKEMTVSAGADGVNVLVTPAPADSAVPNKWCGLNADNWTTPECWTKGAPVNDQTIEIDYTARIANIRESINLNKIIVAAGIEAQFVVGAKNPSLNVNAIEILGEGEATIALDHVGIQARSGRLDTPSNLNFRMLSTNTDSWLRNLNLKGKLLGNGVLRPYSVYFYGDNSEFNGEIWFMDAGSHICDVAASATNAVWSLQHDVKFDILEGTFKMGAMDCRNQRVWYSALGSTATIEVGHMNIDFGGESSLYFFGPESYNAIEVPEITFKKVGTGTWTNSMKGLRHIIVEEGELALVNCPCEDHKFDNNHGYEIDTLVVKSGATLSGSAGDQPIYSLTLEEGAILKTTLSEVTEGEGEEAVTTVVQSAQPVVAGDVTIEGQGAIVQIDGAELVKTGDKLTLLSVTGEGHQIAGTATLKDGTELPTDESEPSKVWRIRNKATRLELGEGTKGFIVIIQ